MSSAHPYQETQPISFPRLGGLNTTLAPGLIGMSQLTVAENMILSERGSWKKRGGLVPINSTAMTGSAPVKHLIDYWQAGSSGAPSERIVAISGTKIFSSSDAGVNWSDISGSISVPSDSICTHAVVGDVLVMTFAATVPMRWAQTGNVTSLAGTPPNGNLVAQHLNRAWMNEKTDPHKLYFTGVNADGSASPSKWSLANGGGSFYVENDDGDPTGITALWQFGDQLFVGKQTKIYRVEGRTRDTFRPVLVSNGIGVASHNCVVPIGSDVLFPSIQGFHSLQSVMAGADYTPDRRISAPIHTTFHTEINRGRLKHAHGVFIPELNAVIWSMPLLNSTAFTEALYLHLGTRQWMRFVNFRGDALLARYNSAVNNTELFSAGQTGMVYKYTKDTLADYSSDSINARLKSGHIYPSGRFGNKHKFKKYVILVYPDGDHTFTLSYKTDSTLNSSGVPASTTVTEDQGASGAFVPMGSSFIMGTNLMGADSMVQPIRIDLAAEGQAFEWELTQSGLNQDFEVGGYYLEIESESQAFGRLN